MRVVLDTNVYISAILFGGKCEEILRFAALGSYDLIISESILKELKSILDKKFHWSKKQISETLSYVKGLAEVIKPDISLSVIKNDPSDNKILECALKAKAAFIVSGDKAHLLPLKVYKGIKIMSPSDFLKL